MNTGGGWSRKDVAELVRKARGLLRIQGWTQGYNRVLRYQGDRPTVVFCALGAIYEAAEQPSPLLSVALAELAARVRLADPTTPSAPPDAIITVWNDRLGRTKEEVLAVFDRTAEELEAEP